MAPVLAPGASIDRARPLMAQVYSLLRAAIVGGRLAPGAPVVERALTAELGISRTPIREAIMRLRDEGLIAVWPHSGTFVAPIDADTVEECLLVREALELAVLPAAVEALAEPELARLLAIAREMHGAATASSPETMARLEREFHRIVCTAPRLARAATMIATTEAQIDRARAVCLAADSRPDQVAAEHLWLATALAERDRAQAEAALRAHLRATRDALRVGLAAWAEAARPRA
ncbi:MAG: GntR family transcriptional regulator [Ectothiorhodospiraceae bacterium]|nr:GntR family transcriptional regulator [Ectothiorhodospiraceae bacterium]